MQKLLTFFFSKKKIASMPYLMTKILTNNIISFEQQGPD